MRNILGLFLALFVISSCASASRPSLNIHHAVKRQNLEQVQQFIDQGKIEEKDENGFTPLHIAAYYGEASMLAFLIEKGALVDARDKKEWTPLMYSASYDFLDCVKVLVENKASVNLKNGEDRTALYYADKYGYTDVSEFLKKNGAE